MPLLVNKKDPSQTILITNRNHMDAFLTVPKAVDNKGNNIDAGNPQRQWKLSENDEKLFLKFEEDQMKKGIPTRDRNGEPRKSALEAYVDWRRPEELAQQAEKDRQFSVLLEESKEKSAIAKANREAEIKIQAEIAAREKYTTSQAHQPTKSQPTTTKKESKND